MTYSQIVLWRLLRLRLSLWRLLLPLLLWLLLLQPHCCLDAETKLAKLKKLINKKIKIDINEKYQREKERKSTNQYISFLYIHELTAIDYVEYVLNKSDDYDCVLFVMDVESNNGVSMFDRKNLILLEMFNRVARDFILGSFSLYSEGGSIGWKGHIPSSTPIFFFYINLHKPTILPLKYVNAIEEVPEFFYVGKETFLHLDYYSKVRPSYMLESYLKMKRLSGSDKAETSNKMIEAYFSDFIQTHNRGGAAGGSGSAICSAGYGAMPTLLEANYLGKIQRYLLTIALAVLFLLLYFLLQLIQRWPCLMFVCSYVLFLICLSGIFHCLINKSELYNTAKNLDSILHKYIYRSTSAQYVYEGVAFSLFIFFITFALLLLCRHSSNRFMTRGGRNLWLALLLLVTYASLDVIHEMNLYKVYYSTYFFFPPTKFFRK
ncbi:hypothetical protein C922_04895 [Plasmodium inui San Antonio 1]|uniref:Uncharacterized protein n=1 Tax=Plasmodium inui San Antonio 1 TaxID=1237626 RepID=W7AHK2_9APIC|nr:hypothetical protein C922_04895 [Plasmodium inui San Antonio 1]EUD64751.1 hypothetical protein C922_04895 [Plasmodium inui San Antonio 1]